MGTVPLDTGTSGLLAAEGLASEFAAACGLQTHRTGQIMASYSGLAVDSRVCDAIHFDSSTCQGFCLCKA